ncbi:MAG: MBL fold metallo-hydrolase [Anaerovoracaceae bacterium]|nr:MBL fold metallo-hydrolase [Anaerovoracaceae bacterium]
MAMKAIQKATGLKGYIKRHIHGKQFIILALLAVMMAMTACSSSDSGSESHNGGQTDAPLEAHFLDVGQADCTILVSEGEAMMVDAGNMGDAGAILAYLDQLGIQRLKYVVFTHPHEDHIGSGEAIVNSLEIDKIYMLDEYDEGIEGSLKSAIDSKGIETEAPYPGDKASLGECTIEFIGPVYEYDDTNDDSICLKVNHGDNSIMFTGDAGSSPERDMIESGAALEADILQAGHHGSSGSNSYYFLREVNPEYVVISCEKGNMYGHPHEEALSRFNDLGAEVFRTDTQGTIIAVSDGGQFTFNVEGKKADKPYTEDFQEAEYIGNVNSRKYHLPSCGSLPKEENRAYFMTKEAAESAGYEPCGNCRP